MPEEFDWAARAAGMVARLGPLPTEVAEALRSVPRHRFVDERDLGLAYDDEPLPLPWGEATISAPHMVALQLQAAALRPGDRVLEIGTGFGYLAALAATLVGPTGHVTTVEIDPGLTREARRRLAATGFATRVDVAESDGALGWPASAPYDRIVVSCAAAQIARAWLAQLAPHGRIVAPMGGATVQHLTTVVREGTATRTEIGTPCRFVPLRGFSHSINRP